MPTVTFKLPDDYMAKLQHKAQQCNFRSAHMCAQQIVINYLDDEERDRARKQMAELQREVFCLREDLATAVTALLLQEGKPADPDEVRQWVEQNLMSS